MMGDQEVHQELLVAKLASRALLDDDDRAAIRALPCQGKTVDPATYLVREGSEPQRCQFILSGYAYRQKLTREGSRQIVALMIPGDFVDLQQMFLRRSDHNVQALTRLHYIEIPIVALRKLATTRPNASRALWVDALVDASIFREWIVSIGRRDARERVSHLLCEFAVRARTAGIAFDGDCALPMTQEQLGDALGLTPVHVNRVLKALAADGFIERNRRQITILDWNGLRNVADFNDRYLHLDQASPE
jgi:CRP-like cAMP-binding protein